MAGFSTPDITNDKTVLDFVRAVWPTLLKESITNIIQTRTSYMVSDWFKNVDQKDGQYLEWPLLVKLQKTGRHVLLGEKDAIGIENVTQMASVQWCQYTYHYAWLVQEILRSQNNPRAIIDLMKARRASIQLGIVDDLEASLWGAPSSTSEAKTKPTGIPFWVQKKSTAGTAAGAFEGGNPSGFSTGAGGISVSDYPTWANYTFRYTTWGDDDVTRLRNAAERMNFKKPNLGKVTADLPADEACNIHLYMGLETKRALEKYAKSNNDTLGFDLANNTVTFNRLPLEYVPVLDDDTDKPLYLIDRNSFKVYAGTGDFFRESEPKEVSGAHNQIVVNGDLTYQYVALNRRANGVGMYGAD